MVSTHPILIGTGEALFVGNDVAKILGYAYPANAVYDHVDNDDKTIMQLSEIQDVNKTPHLKGSKIVMISESGINESYLFWWLIFQP